MHINTFKYCDGQNYCRSLTRDGLMSINFTKTAVKTMMQGGFINLYELCPLMQILL